MNDTLIKNVRLAEKDGLWDVLVKNGLIQTIGSHPLAVEAAFTIDGGGRLLGPGLISAHHHLDKALILDGRPFPGGGIPARAKIINDWKRTATEEEVCAKALKAAREAVASGVTTLRTSVDVDPIWGLTGMKGILAARDLCKGYIDIEAVAFAQEGVLNGQVPDMLCQALQMGAVAVGGHTDMEADTISHLDEILRIAKRYGVPAEFHVDESDDPKTMHFFQMIDRVQAAGYGKNTVAIHCLALSGAESEVRKMAARDLLKNGIKVVACPTIVGLGLPVAPVRELMEEGVTVACGSDNLRDPFGVLGEISPLRAAKLLALLGGFDSDENLIRLYRMITVSGAELLNLRDRGMVAVGLLADLALFDGASCADVIRRPKEPKWVMKAGRLVWFDAI